MENLQEAKRILDNQDFGPIDTHGFKSAADMNVIPDRKQMARLILGVFATATCSFNAFEDTYGVDPDELDSIGDFSGVDAPPRSVLLAQRLVPEGFDVILDEISPDGALSFTAQNILAWDQGNGPDPTEEQFRGIAKMIMAMKETMQPIMKAVSDYARPGDDLDLGIFAFTAYEHYLIGIFGECNCPASEMMRDMGVDLSRFDEYMDDARTRLARVVHEEVSYQGNESRLSDMDEEAAEIAQEYGDDLHMQ